MWNGDEKSYEMDQWGGFLHMLLSELGYQVVGVISAQGEDEDDVWHMVATDCGFREHDGTYGNPTHHESAQNAQKVAEDQEFSDVTITDNDLRPVGFLALPGHLVGAGARALTGRV